MFLAAVLRGNWHDAGVCEWAAFHQFVGSACLKLLVSVKFICFVVACMRRLARWKLRSGFCTESEIKRSGFRSMASTR